MSVEELTKKEQIINFAQSDPFLKISDIADHVQTTPRYVRTILSEANISLMKLREKYARNMEKRLKNNKSGRLQAKVSLKEEYSYNQLKIGNIKIEPADERQYSEIRKINDKDSLVKIYQTKYIDDSPYIVHQLITYLEKDINQERLNNLNSIYDLLGRRGINRLQFMHNILTVSTPDREMSEYFEGDDQIIYTRRTVLLNKIPIGIERICFKSDLAKMEFSGEIVI
ncbi:MAG: GntR family transcriptional regulator [Halanaerobiales bacterium]